VRHEEASAWEMLRQLEIDTRETAEARKAAEDAARDALRLKDRVERERVDLERRRKAILEKTAADAQTAVREAREQARAIIADLRQRGADRSVETHHATEALGAMDRDLAAIRERLDNRPTARPAVAFHPSVGDAVRVVRFGQKGTVIERGAGDEVTVAVGALKMKLAASDLEPAAPGPAAPQRAPGQGIQTQKAATTASELKLIGMRVEEATEALDKYLDDALLSGIPEARIIHGKGTGALKNAVWEWLRGHHAIRSFRIGADGEGGSGATVVQFTGS
jgi:DNA mismatch repair protein MutS2